MLIVGNTHTEDSFVGDTTSKMLHESNRYIRRCMGASEEDVLLFCGSGTTAAIKRLQEVMGISVPSIIRDKVLATLGLRERWVVFIGPYEHHSNILSWRQSLAEVVEVPLNQQGLIDLVFLEEALRSPRYVGRPKLGSFSACSNVTGILTNTRRIARLLHEHNAFACFDFASCGGYSEIDMRSHEVDGYDAVFLSPHKFIGGPGTCGLLLMNKKLYMLADGAPSTAGGGVVSFVNSNEDETLYVKDIERREDAGTPAILQRIKTALTFWIKEEMGVQLIETQEQYFITTAMKRLSKHPNILLLGNTQVKRAAILSFIVYAEPSPPAHQQQGRRSTLQARFVVKLLNDLFGIQARGGCSCAGPYGHELLNVSCTMSLKLRKKIEEGYESVKPGWTRISFAYFLSIEDFDFILSAVEFIADLGRRFIPLYKLDWQSGTWTLKKDLIVLLKMRLKIHRQQCNPHPSIADRRRHYLQLALKMANVLPKVPLKNTSVPESVDPELANFQF